LSTANPAIGGNPPILYPLLAKYTEARVFSSRGTKGSKSIRSRDVQDEKLLNLSVSEGDNDDDARPMETNVTEKVSNQGTSVSYAIKQLVTIDSDNKPHKVKITTLTLSSEFDYIAVPALTDNAYFRSHAKNDSEFQLIEGPINVFINNVFVTQSELTTVSPSEKFTMYLGVDKSINVRVKPSSDKDSKQGIIFGRKNVQSVKKEVVISNTKVKEVSVCVYQQLPFAKDETIKVKVTEPIVGQTENVKCDEFSIFEWKLNIESGQSETVVLEYTIESPPEKQLFFQEQTSYTKTSY